jgi:hypothetical protein
MGNFATLLLTILLPILITIFEVPLHEGLHALLAIVLPHASCGGIELNDNFWYSHLLQLLTAGFYRAKDLPAGIGGWALISARPDFLGYLSQTLIAAVSEVVTMMLGFYWIKSAVLNVRTKGKMLSALVRAYCGLAVASSSFFYLRLASLAPRPGADYYGFTEGVIKMATLPTALTPYLTWLGGALMVTAALYLANLLPSKE